MEISLHFTTIEQSITAIEDKLFSNRFYQKMVESDVLNHCFMPWEEVKKRGFSLEVIQFLGSVCDHERCWFNNLSDINIKRKEMLDFIKDRHGVAIFVGKITEGVKIEYDYAIEKGLTVMVIP
jgi:hypothetical protein